MMTTIQDVLRQAALRLQAAGVETPRLDAEVLLAFVTHRERVYFYAHPEAQLSADALAAFEAALQRRIKREPVAYITGTKAFMGLEFAVSPDVLIPRPDSEVLVETAAQAVGTVVPENARVLDLCCGSGALGLSLKALRPEISLTLTDISPEAARITQTNARRLGLAAEITTGDLFECVRAPFDLIISNPPYIPDSAVETLAPEIRAWEPGTALRGGADGYTFYERIAQECPSVLAAPGLIILETGDGQAPEVSRLFEHQGFKTRARTDLTGTPRALCAYTDRRIV